MSNHVAEASESFYNDSRTIGVYSQSAALFPAELSILHELSSRLAGMDMLDLGVGAGRTTASFAPLVRRYTGSDFSAQMIAECQRKFPALAFFVADASELSMVPDASYDFILFSFNGLDCISAEGRARALAEFHRVLRPGGVLAFSSHNLQFVPHAGTWRRFAAKAFSRDWLATAKNLARFAARTRSVKIAPDRNTALVTERHLGFDVPIYFIRPGYQIEVLKMAGWHDIRLFLNENGQQSVQIDDIPAIEEPWIYYMCEKPQAAGPK